MRPAVPLYLTPFSPCSGSREKQSESLCAWSLLRDALFEKGLLPNRLSPNELKGMAERGPYGKPFLPELPVAFSLSHSRGLCGCALGDRPLGLDIQREQPFSSGVVGRLLAPGEKALTGELSQSLLTQLWTCKESHMKLTGRGLSQGLQKTVFRRLGREPELMEGRAFFQSIRVLQAGCWFWVTLCSWEPVEAAVQWVSGPLPCCGTQ